MVNTILKCGKKSVAERIVYGAIDRYADAGGVRRTVGHQSTVLNKMLDEFFTGNKEFSQRLGEIIGHTKWEVFVGALLGIAFGLIFSWPW